MSSVQGTPSIELQASLVPEIERIIAQYEEQALRRSSRSRTSSRSTKATSPQRRRRDRATTSGRRLATVESTISFYTLLFRKPVGKYMVQICRNLSCLLNGAEDIMAYARRAARHRPPRDHATTA